jgi:hypothetical protein
MTEPTTATAGAFAELSGDSANFACGCDPRRSRAAQATRAASVTPRVRGTQRPPGTFKQRGRANFGAGPRRGLRCVEGYQRN